MTLRNTAAMLKESGSNAAGTVSSVDVAHLETFVATAEGLDI